jgi:hypothetical protein
MPKANNSKPRKLRFFPPWFLTKATTKKIEALLPYYYHKRFRFYFDAYGCVRCGRKDVPYSCSGLCIPCQGFINHRLERSDRAMKRQYAAHRSYLSPFPETPIKCTGIAKGSKTGLSSRLSYAFLILFSLTTVLVISSKRFLSGSVIWLTAWRIRSKARRPLPRDAQSLLPFWGTFLAGGSSCPS